MVTMTYNKDLVHIDEIRINKSYQRNNSKHTYYAQTDEQVQALVKQFMIENIFERIIIYGLFVGILFYFFRFKGFEGFQVNIEAYFIFPQTMV